jgi:hypothetical protein
MEINNLMTIIDKNNDFINDINNIYNVKEEVELDKKIKELENDTDSIITSSSDFSSRSIGSFDSDDSEDSEDRLLNTKNNNDSDNDSILNGDNVNDLDSDLLEKYQNMVNMKKELKKNIDEKEKYISKAQDKLVDDIYEKRCMENNKKKEIKKRKNDIEILKSNKTVFTTLVSKMKDLSNNESIIPSLFKDKYIVIKFMCIHDLINFSSNNEIEEEYEIFDNLYKVIKSYEKSLINTNELSDSDDDLVDDPMNDIDDDLIDICEKFMEYILNLDEVPMTEESIHTLLNNNLENDDEKKIFSKDISKDKYE